MEKIVDVMKGLSPVESQVVLAQADQIITIQWAAGKYTVEIEATGMRPCWATATPRQAAALMALAINSDTQENGEPYEDAAGDAFSQLLYPIAEAWLAANAPQPEYRLIP